MVGFGVHPVYHLFRYTSVSFVYIYIYLYIRRLPLDLWTQLARHIFDWPRCSWNSWGQWSVQLARGTRRALLKMALGRQQLYLHSFFRYSKEVRLMEKILHHQTHLESWPSCSPVNIGFKKMSPKQRSWMTEILHRRTKLQNTTLKRGCGGTSHSVLSNMPAPVQDFFHQQYGPKMVGFPFQNGPGKFYIIIWMWSSTSRGLTSPLFFQASFDSTVNSAPRLPASPWIPPCHNWLPAMRSGIL